MRLPNIDNAVIRPAKITHYLLSKDHPVGRHKAKFFNGYGFSLTAWHQLESALLRHARQHEVFQTVTTPFGVSYTIDGTLLVPDGRFPCVRAVWFIESGQEMPYFVTAYPIENKRIL